MAGKVNENYTLEQQTACYIKNIQYAADVMAEHGIRVLIEPINTAICPDTFDDAKQAEALLPEIARENVFIQLDLYHCQIMEGDY